MRRAGLPGSGPGWQWPWVAGALGHSVRGRDSRARGAQVEAFPYAPRAVPAAMAGLTLVGAEPAGEAARPRHRHGDAALAGSAASPGLTQPQAPRQAQGRLHVQPHHPLKPGRPGVSVPARPSSDQLASGWHPGRPCSRCPGGTSGPVLREASLALSGAQRTGQDWSPTPSGGPRGSHSPCRD